ncbi:MAG TPA: cysteine desulfurase family protein [Haliscomenobacter sp.]|uniref:Cysteine desulfurase n=1 Tax=Haliscomenobacter hydrossis (strain ATCC 27775 / DSM 1100 / LMG 10767 / O) TaxID=760192 RepID=F4KY06_HALH1|nr:MULTISPECIES: cysteine desulfurase family protein [Haliscomenobacter]AEE53631.1 Cysteine desulfurase [Haliscomenobacter hydrossis DSM 1100]HOY18691.1 cysteine desulfurase family protein [Haliscomenobacter sp.]HPH20375.1 cysteine desulfurase family protein [Haliscomenobacter sp.]
MRIYLDNAATTPIDERVIETMLDALRRTNGNPSSIHQEGRTARAAIEQARRQIARVLNASIGEIFFTSGGTESSNMALKRAVQDLGVQRIISARTEHHCVWHSLETLEKEQGVEIVFVEQESNGHIRLEHLETLLQQNESKTLVSLMHANNEIGTLLDLDSVSALCTQYNALFHTDTVQTIGYYPIDLSKTKVAFLTGSAHKFHGPKGIGFIYINTDNMIHPFIDGGSQERNMRGGTENIPGILGMAKALELAGVEMEQRRLHIQGLRDYFAQELQTQFVGLEFNGDPFGQGHYKILSVGFPPGPRTDLLLLNLDIAGVAVSGGSACSSGVDVGSHVMNALRPGSLQQTLRFSFSHLNTREEVDKVLHKLKEILG